MAGMENAVLSHVGIYARDLEAMCRFYTEVLGFTVTDRGGIGGNTLVFLSRSPSDHHQVVLVSGREAGAPTTVNQLSFKVARLADVRAMYEKVSALGLEGIRPVSHGNAWSVYFPDPEGNRIEVFMDTPWYVAQPRGDPLDLSLSDEEIHRRTEAQIRDDPSFAPVEDWRRRAGKAMAGAG